MESTPFNTYPHRLARGSSTTKKFTNELTTDDMRSKLQRLAEVGLLQKMRAMKTAAIPKYEDDEEDDEQQEQMEQPLDLTPPVDEDPPPVQPPPSRISFHPPAAPNASTTSTGINSTIKTSRRSKSDPNLSRDASITKSYRKRGNDSKKRRSRSTSKDRQRSARKHNMSKDRSCSRASSAQSFCDSVKSETSSDLRKFKIRGKVYVLLSVLGKGGSSKVYQVFEPSTQRTLAVKLVDLTKTDNATKMGYENEIQLLKKLAHCKRVVRLYDYERVKSSNGELKKLFLVMEKGDADLSTVLKQFYEADAKYLIDPHVIKHYWKEMLKAVDEIHSNGIVHSDLKPVNFIIVAGKLKLIDFGIANAIQADHTSVIKNTLVGTLNFMSPESLDSRPDLDKNGTKTGKTFTKFNCKTDIWSLGCILYNLVYGKPPFGHLPSVIAKVQAICNPKHAISFPPYDDANLVDCMKKCLIRDPSKRPTANELLEHPCFRIN